MADSLAAPGESVRFAAAWVRMGTADPGVRDMINAQGDPIHCCNPWEARQRPVN